LKTQIEIKQRNPISLKNIPRSLKNTSFAEVKRCFKIDLTKMRKRDNLNCSEVHNSRTETFTTTPQNLSSNNNSLIITREDQKILQQDQIALKKRKIHKNLEIQNPPRRHEYINEFGEHSFFTEPEDQEIENFKHFDKENLENKTCDQSTQNEYVYSTNSHYQRPLNPF
jgi:NAD+--asparagine ADP-ribosyltransferase